MRIYSINPILPQQNLFNEANNEGHLSFQIRLIASVFIIVILLLLKCAL